MTYHCTVPCNHPIDKCWGSFGAAWERSEAAWAATHPASDVVVTEVGDTGAVVVSIGGNLPEDYDPR